LGKNTEGFSIPEIDWMNRSKAGSGLLQNPSWQRIGRSYADSSYSVQRTFVYNKGDN
jgi:hypothetical protein